MMGCYDAMPVLITYLYYVNSQSDQEEKQQQFVISTGVDVHNVTVTDTTPGIYEFKVHCPLIGTNGKTISAV